MSVFAFLYPSKGTFPTILLSVVMNYQTYTSRRETEAARSEEEEKKAIRPELTPAQKKRAELIKSALNRTARERRMATHR